MNFNLILNEWIILSANECFHGNAHWFLLHTNKLSSNYFELLRQFSREKARKYKVYKLKPIIAFLLALARTDAIYWLQNL